jgi:O-antigen/teichoic acid export membrane protein
MPTQCAQRSSSFFANRWKLNETVGNGLYNVITSVLSTAGRTLIFVLGPMFLDAAHFGVYAYYSWLAAVASQLGSGGAVQAAQHYTSRFSREGFQRALERSLFATSLGLTGATAGILLCAPSAIAGTPLLIVLTLTLALATSVAAVEQAFQQAKQDFRHPMLCEAKAQGTRVLALSVVRFASLVTAFALVVVDAFSMLMKAAALLMTAGPKVWRATVERELGTAERRAVRGYVASITGICLLNVMLWQRGEIFFLSMFSNPASTAHFAAASQLAQLLVLAPSAVLSSLLPKLSEKAGVDTPNFHDVSNVLLTASVLVALPLYCMTMLVAPVMLRAWKPEYMTVGSIFPQVMLGKLALVLSAPVSLALYAAGRQKTVLHVVCVSAALAVAVDYVLIRAFGLSGASWASAFNQVFTAVATFIAARKYLPLRLVASPLTLRVCAVGGLIQVSLSFTRFSTVSAIGWVLVSCAVLSRDEFVSRILVPRLRRR